MKKICLSILLILVIFLTGCGKENKEKVRNNFINDIENLKNYHMEGTLSITNNEDTYDYEVSVSYSKKDNFKVLLKNKSNNYEQVILRNSDGVYVINPSLNKSFKFQSEWPYNNSQSYLLHSLASDLKKDNSYSFSQKNNNYIFTTKVDYPNNPDLKQQIITLNKDLELKEVKVVDKNNAPFIVFTVKSIDKKAVFANNYFALETVCKDYKLTTDNTTKETPNNTTKKNTDNTATKESNKSNTNTNDTNNTSSINTKKTLSIDEALFPLYLPKNTSLSNRETIATDNGQRVIMTFSGDNSFILVQENVSKESEFTTIPTAGDPYLLVDTVGALTSSSYTWISNGIEYYIVSDVMGQDELLQVAKSINVVATMNEK